MAPLVHCGPSLLLLLCSAAAQPTNSMVLASGGGGINLTTAILFGALIVALFSLGFFTAYLRRCIRSRSFSSDATASAAAAAAAAIAAPPTRRRRGLDASAIDSFPTIPFSALRRLKPTKLRNAPECTICLSEFSDEEMLRVLPGCRHVFHATCIDTWLASHITCPVCRADLSDLTVPAADQCLMEDLADERLSDTIEIVVEVFHPDLDPDPDPEPDLAVVPLTVPVYPESTRKEIDLAKRHRRAMSLVSIHGRRSGPLQSVIRSFSVHQQIQAESSLGERSSKLMPQGEPRHLNPTERLQHSTDRHEIISGAGDISGGSRGSRGEVGPTCSQKERNYAHSVTFTGFVIHGDVAANDWLPEIFQVSTAMQSAPSNCSHFPLSDQT